VWVLKWAELLQIRSSNQVSYKAMLLYFNWLQDKVARKRTGQRMGRGTALGQRRNAQEPGHQFLPGRDRHPEGDRKCRPGIHGHAQFSAPSATITRSTAGRWTITMVSPRSSVRSAARGRTTRAKWSCSTPAAASRRTPSAAG